MWRSADREQGFSLVEVMTALAIAALAIVALYRGLTQSSQATQVMDNRLAATLLARSLLDDALETPIKDGLDRDGNEGALAWKLTARPATGATARLAPRGMALYDVTVTVTWAPRGSLALTSLALGR